MATGTIVINDDLRTMQIPSTITLLGVESDDDVNKIAFQMPKEYCGYDLSAFEARINYMNANGDGDIYIVDDLAVDGDDPSLMNFTWLVGRNACAYKGNTKFIVCLKKFDGTNTVVQEFNTTVYNLPVLEGLETTEAVQQENADIIEYILQLINSAGIVDFTNYYTKAEVNALLPTKLPNPEKLTINGTEYDGSAAVELTINATSEFQAEASGVLVHVEDAAEIANNIISISAYDSNDDPLTGIEVALTNRNLFRPDAIPDQYSTNGITFVKQADGGVKIFGTSSFTYPNVELLFNPNILQVGQTYTLSTSKTSGVTYIQLALSYTDGAADDYIVSRNTSRTFTIEHPVATATVTLQLTDSGVTVNNEVIYPQLEVGSIATKFTVGEYNTYTLGSGSLPDWPASVSNMYPTYRNGTSPSEVNIVVVYYADTISNALSEFADTMQLDNASTISHDGEGNVYIRMR